MAEKRITIEMTSNEPKWKLIDKRCADKNHSPAVNTRTHTDRPPETTDLKIKDKKEIEKDWDGCE